jgi:Trk-type K+ transport system membrane component
MFDRLSSLAQFHRRPVIAFAIVFFLIAGAMGGTVADKLDPYGED